MEAKMPNPLLRTLSKNWLKTRRVFFRYRNKMTGKTRPTSYPLVTGDSFRALADHIYDETGTFTPDVVQTGDIVFVNNPLTLSYLQNINPHIKHPYILISHNGDCNMDKEIADLIDDKIVRFYVQDAIYEHPKMIPIPIGIENLHLYMNGVPQTFNQIEKKIKRNPPIKKNRILFRFSVHTNPKVRKPLLEQFTKHPLMETFTEMLPPPLHMKYLMMYKFVASPPGNSIESCRTYEALHLKTIPIVQDYFAYRYFVSIGLPMWIVKDWKELNTITEQDLITKYDALMKHAVYDALHMDFWIKMIRTDQETGRKMEQSTSTIK